MFSESLLKIIAQIAPGTELREGLERILRSRTGALIVLGNDRTVAHMSSGGFAINTEFSATRVRELAKMDGAIICDKDASTLLAAGVQLLPDPAIETNESGTRHRTAERVAKQTGFPVIAVSASMSMISVYAEGIRYTVEDTQSLMNRANQAIRTLDSYTERLEQVLQQLSSLEIEASVTLRDVVLTLQRMEMVRRITVEAGHYVVELGNVGRLVALQLEELTSHNLPESWLVLRDYLPVAATPEEVQAAVRALASLDDKEIVDPLTIARTAGLGEELESTLHPHGHRLLASIKSMPGAVADRLVERFDGLQSLMAASLDDLRAVEGIGEQRARVIRESLSRMAESSLLERFM
ncbi:MULTISPECIES: DNA integrity scanning diadenylate cyclase DisA [Rothia]|uniref:DNA integrity scanning protein DisA n=1 Tax=Rothia nasimurium TaxID=85336 RepID=A0A1Y1RNY2_9MICC|nr:MULTISPECIES: DNA integrity scanning diadenylate cyclase DisA [Rothia]ORC16573.1 DNA integrity scanning protein DisA [Rothia nasimurium]